MIVIAEVVGAVITSFGFTQILGLVTAVFAILGAKSMMGGGSHQTA